MGGVERLFAFASDLAATKPWEPGKPLLPGEQVRINGELVRVLPYSSATFIAQQDWVDTQLGDVPVCLGEPLRAEFKGQVWWARGMEAWPAGNGYPDAATVGDTREPPSRPIMHFQV